MDWDKIELEYKEIEQFLKEDEDWVEEYIGLWINPNYEKIAFIDTNTYSIKVHFNENHGLDLHSFNEKIVVLDSDTIYVQNLYELKCVLKKMSNERWEFPHFDNKEDVEIYLENIMISDVDDLFVEFCLNDEDYVKNYDALIEKIWSQQTQA